MPVLLALVSLSGGPAASTGAEGGVGVPTPSPSDDPRTETYYLPFVGSSSLPSTHMSDRLTDAGWQTFESAYWHLSFKVPGGWTVKEQEPGRARRLDDDPANTPDGTGYRLEVTSPTDPDGYRIDIAYYLTEKPPAQNLAEWVTKKKHLESLHMGVPRTITDTHSISVQTKSGMTQEILIGTTETSSLNTTYRSRSAFVSYGRIVYVFGTLDESKFAIVEEMARSFTFTEDAPATLDELHGTTLGDSRQTVEEQIEFWDQPANPDYCDIVCRDRKKTKELGIESSPD